MKLSKIWNWIILVILTLHSLAMLVLLSQPRMVHLLIEVGNPQSIPAEDSAEAATHKTGALIILFLLLAVGVGGILWQRGVLRNIPASKWKFAIGLIVAGIMVVSILNHIAPGLLDWWAQIAVVVGIVAIALLVDTGRASGGKMLAWTLGIALVLLVIHNATGGFGKVADQTQKLWQESKTAIAQASPQPEPITDATMVPAPGRWKLMFSFQPEAKRGPSNHDAQVYRNRLGEMEIRYSTDNRGNGRIRVKEVAEGRWQGNFEQMNAWGDICFGAGSPTNFTGWWTQPTSQIPELRAGSFQLIRQ